MARRRRDADVSTAPAYSASNIALLFLAAKATVFSIRRDLVSARLALPIHPRIPFLIELLNAAKFLAALSFPFRASARSAGMISFSTSSSAFHEPFFFAA